MTSIRRKVDIVFCVDVSMSMQNYLNDIKGYILSFWPELEEHYSYWHKSISSIRVKIVLFNESNAESKIRKSVFYDLNVVEDMKEFISQVESMSSSRNIYDMNSALKALSCAIQSNWNEPDNGLGSSFCRHVIIFFTCGTSDRNNSIVQLQEFQSNSIDRLIDLWEHDSSTHYSMSSRGKRLVLFTPQESPWTEIYDNCSYVIGLPSPHCDVFIDNAVSSEVFEAIISPI